MFRFEKFYKENPHLRREQPPAPSVEYTLPQLNKDYNKKKRREEEEEDQEENIFETIIENKPTVKKLRTILKDYIYDLEEEYNNI